MSDSELSSSDSSSEGSEIIRSSDEEDYFVFNGHFEPYQDEPLAGSDDSDEKEDGILPSVLEQRFEGQVPLNEW